MHINIDSIMSKVKGFVDSDVGQKKMDNKIMHYRKSDTSKTAAGCNIITFEEMNDFAYKMIDILTNQNEVYSLPESVRNHFEYLVHTEPKELYEGVYYTDIMFSPETDLSRKSLFALKGKKAGTRTGSGIKNIVSLFDTGYNASKRVVGSWDGHSMEGQQVYSLTHRDPLGFMLESVEEFNRQYKDLYGVEAMITADTEFYVGNHMRGLG